MRFLALLPLVAACASPNEEVVGPFNGVAHRYVIDRYDLPTTNTVAHELADDLDGDGTRDNAIGSLFSTLELFRDFNMHADAMRRVLPTVIMIQASDLQNDDGAAVSYIGRSGDEAVPVGGRFVNGVFTSNRSTATHTAAGVFVLPVFADADPTTLVLSRGEIDLTPDATGFNALVRGVVTTDSAAMAAAIGVAQMVSNNPRDHASLGIDLDSNRDGRVSMKEAATADVMTSVLVPDLGTELSIGFGVHLVSCASGDCIATPTTDTCFDRVQDGDETSIDCGGSCQPCGFDSRCKVAADCQSGACEASGMCAEPTCSDGIQNGFELGVDCGSPDCGVLCPGQQCAGDSDCQSHQCLYQVCVDI